MINQSDGESRLNVILNQLCSGIETPTIQVENELNDKRLIEIIEEKSYPYSALSCPHLEEKGIGEDCVECIYQQYETYKSRFVSLSEEKGYEHTHTLKAAFDYYTSLITQYRLTEGDELLDKIFSACVSRGTWSSYYILAIQARAFLRFKQGKYQEALDYFIQQIDILGPHEAIYENMALVYSRLGEYKEASTCYARAILLIRQKPLEKQKFSTLLMGLSTVLDSFEDSLTVLEESMKILKMRFDKPHSLMAKTLGAMGDLYIKHQDIAAAEKCYEEAVRIFIDTCGFETPLTSNAMSKYAKALLLLGNNKQAIDVYIESLSVWANVDNNSFEPNIIAEALSALIKETSAGNISDQTSEKMLITLESLQKKIENNPSLSNDLNTLCILKIMSELYILNKDFSRAIASCKSFRDCLSHLNKTDLGELSEFRDKFVQETDELLEILGTLGHV